LSGSAATRCTASETTAPKSAARDRFAQQVAIPEKPGLAGNVSTRGKQLAGGGEEMACD
jgi:hypothetical protein